MSLSLVLSDIPSWFDSVYISLAKYHKSDAVFSSLLPIRWCTNFNLSWYSNAFFHPLRWCLDLHFQVTLLKGKNQNYLFSQPTHLITTELYYPAKSTFYKLHPFLKYITHYLSCFFLINGSRSQSVIKSIGRWVKPLIKTILQLFQWLCLGLLRALKGSFASYML